MKRIFAALFFLMLWPAVAIAESVGGWHDTFMGAYITRYGLSIPVSGLPETRIRRGDWGLGFLWGQKYDKNFSREIDGEWRTILIERQKIGETDNIWNLAAFAGGRARAEVFGRDIHPKLSGMKFHPYAGLGVGLSIWMNDVNYMTTTYGGPGHGGGSTDHYDTSMKIAIAYQVKFGLMIPLNDKFEMDVGIRRQNLGRPGNSGDPFNISGPITNTEFRLGAIYKH